MRIRPCLPRALLALAAAAALAACAGATGPHPPIVAGGAGSLGRSADWGFGARTQTPGFTFDRGGGGA